MTGAHIFTPLAVLAAAALTWYLAGRPGKPKLMRFPSDRPGVTTEMVIMPKTRLRLLWESVAPWLAVGLAAGLGWVVRGWLV